MSEPQQATLHGEYLERPTYSLLHTVGVGAEGKSILWVNEVHGRQVVSKTIDLFGVPGGVARSEPRILMGLRHDRVVRIFEAQWDGRYPPERKVVTFTTEYCEGRTVYRALEEGYRFSVSGALQIAYDILDALDYVHVEHELVHRDVKPDNVMLDADRRRGYLGDFGSAARLAAGRVPAGGQTRPYTAPEAVDGGLDVRADLYGVGMVLLEMLNGPLPIDDLDYRVIDKRLAERRRSQPDRYFQPAPWVAPKVARIVRTLCARDPERRPDTAADAMRLFEDAACVDWRRESGEGFVGRWEGRWPPNAPASRSRQYRVVAEPVGSGQYKGKVKLTAAWRTAGRQWRGYRSLTRRVDADDAGKLAAFFRAVEAAASDAPVR
ncbi:serine/threonine-protein kinase [Nocardioides jensenii]|uniref:serine/threonine-protein kinase n=1 Tax=Nocardioides jensenii TaxID=1843 RepID=UPI00082C5D5C|nr:serine/threonine-protein kinase [Nocardioides jensenii]